MENIGGGRGGEEVGESRDFLGLWTRLLFLLIGLVSRHMIESGEVINNGTRRNEQF